VTDCIFSYALQVAGRVRGGWLKLNELHARPEANPSELVDALAAVGQMFTAVLRDAPTDMISSDAYVDLRLADWVARAATVAVSSERCPAARSARAGGRPRC